MDISCHKRRCPPRRQRVTINDVAASLGMTKSTVSRALNGYPDISEATRLRVQNAVDYLGYRPLTNAQAIRTGRVRSIGLILQLNEHDRHRPFLADFLSGVSEAASAADWTITLSTGASDADTLRLLTRLLDERKVDGFILPRTYVDDARIAFLTDADVPFILYGRTGQPNDCAWFDIESEAAMQSAVGVLAALGHRRIGFVPGTAGYMYSKLRYEGYRRGLDDNSLQFDAALIANPALNPEQGRLAALQLLAQKTPPTALICAMDNAALGVFQAAEGLSLKVGRDLSVISYDGIPEGALTQPPLTTYSVDTHQAGRRLTELLIRRILGEPPQDLRELLPATFMARGSHGAPCMTPQQLADHIESQTT